MSESSTASTLLNRKHTTQDAPITQPLPPAHIFNSSSASTLLPEKSNYVVRGDIPNTPLAVSLISVSLGGIAVSSLLFTIFSSLGWIEFNGWGSWARPQWGVYLAALSIFHLLEFWVTAGWNADKLSVDAFLLNNGIHYPMAHLVGAVEYFTLAYFWPRESWWWFQQGWVLLALPLLVGAQALRTLAMVHASNSFSHVVSRNRKAEDHVLVTSGVYQFSRHPSYTGFFYWALATQLMLGNIISTIGFAYVLGTFFDQRIIDEEKHLVRFFGQDYVDFRNKVGTWLPIGIVSKGAR